MRVIVGMLMAALAACSGASEQEEAAATGPVPSAETSAERSAMPVQSAAMMAIPSDPQALKRLEAMGYTIHAEEGHLHAPGVKECPAMADGPVM